MYIRVAASSPAWLTRRALSRNSRCIFESGFRRFLEEELSNDEGDGSVFGELEEVVIEAWWNRNGKRVKLGRRNSRIGLGRWRACLRKDRPIIAAFMAYKHKYIENNSGCSQDRVLNHSFVETEVQPVALKRLSRLMSWYRG